MIHKKIVCTWEHGSNAAFIGKKYPVLTVIPKTYKKTITEREDAGGGWYGPRTEKRVVEITDYMVYNGSELVGEISMNHTMFLMPNKWHIILKKEVLPLQPSKL